MMELNTKGFKYQLALHKRYFDQGYGITSIIKYAVGVIGIASFIKTGAELMIILGISYIIFCYLFGLMWIKTGMFMAEIEVSNQYNQFVHEMRKHYK